MNFPINLDSDFFKYFGMLAFGFFILFIISQIFTLNDKLLQSFFPQREGFSSSEADRTTITDQKKVDDELKNTHLSLRKKLQIGSKGNHGAFHEQLQDYLENVELEELLLLNLASTTKDMSDDKLISIGKRLSAYKDIKEAINNAQIPSH